LMLLPFSYVLLYLAEFCRARAIDSVDCSRDGGF